MQVEDGHLAFVRADFTVVIGGEVRSHGVDYFTLVKDGAAWKLRERLVHLEERRPAEVTRPDGGGIE